MNDIVKIGDATLHHGKCEDVMQKLDYVDVVITDPPYGTTACKWDSIIYLDTMWIQLKAITRENAAIIMTASQPFTSKLVSSNFKMFRHEWIYQKRCASNFAQAKFAPMKEHESVLVFCKNRANFYPIKEPRKGSGASRVKYKFSEATRHKSGDFVSAMKGEFNEVSDDLRYPSSVKEFNNRAKGDRGLHPTQKPVALMEYLIKTYTNKGDTVLDFAMGSGTTGVASLNSDRKFIGIEKDRKYFDIACSRIQDSLTKGDKI